MNFDPLARSYRLLEWLAFGRVLQEARLAHLHLAGKARKVLIFGEGDGRFLEQFVMRFPCAEVLVVDSSRRMLQQAESRLIRRLGAVPPNIILRHADATQLKLPGGAFDLVVSHFFLDCFQSANLAHLIPAIRHAAAPGCLWLVSDFQYPHSRSGQLHARIWMSILIPFFRVTTHLEAEELPDWNAAIQAEGFDEQDRQTWLLGLIKASVFRRSQNGESSGPESQPAST